LIDNVQTNFTNVGDLVMDLVQQRIDPYLRGLVQTESEANIEQQVAE